MPLLLKMSFNFNEFLVENHNKWIKRAIQILYLVTIFFLLSNIIRSISSWTLSNGYGKHQFWWHFQSIWGAIGYVRYRSHFELWVLYIDFGWWPFVLYIWFLLFFYWWLWIFNSALRQKWRIYFVYKIIDFFMRRHVLNCGTDIINILFSQIWVHVYIFMWIFPLYITTCSCFSTINSKTIPNDNVYESHWFV